MHAVGLRLLAIAALAATPLRAHSATAQDADRDVPVTFDLEAAVPACEVGSSTDLDYGTVVRGGSSEWVLINETTGALSTSSGINNPSSHSVGHVRVEASNASSLTVTREFPAALDALSFSGKWAGSARFSSFYTTLSDDSDTRTFSSATYTRHYRFGGTVGGISSSTSPGTYDDSISLTIACM